MGNKHRPPLAKVCTVCGCGYIGYSNARKYCDTCQVIKYREATKKAWKKQNAKVQAKEHSTYREGKTKCLMCGAWVKAPAMHSYQKHRVSAHEYKDTFGLAYGKGLLPESLKEVKRNHVFSNGTYKNILESQKSKKARFKKGEDRCYDGIRRRGELGQIKSYTKRK